MGGGKFLAFSGNNKTGWGQGQGHQTWKRYGTRGLCWKKVQEGVGKSAGLKTRPYGWAFCKSDQLVQWEAQFLGWTDHI